MSEIPSHAYPLLILPVFSYISDNGLVHATIVFPTVPCFTLQRILSSLLDPTPPPFILDAG